MIIDATDFSSREPDIGFDLTLKTRTLNTHSRMQQLSPEQIQSLKKLLHRYIDEVMYFVEMTTKPPTA